MKVVIDTNVMISGIFWKGKPHLFLEQWVDGKIDIIVSREILDEYSRVLQKIGKKYDWSSLAWKWTELIFQNAVLIDTPSVFKECRDATDNKFVDCALAGKSKLIVSGDDDLLTLKKVNDINIMQAYEAIRFISKKLG